MGIGRLNGLDGLRGVAAIGCMLFHAHISMLPASHGYRAVDFFFVLSGYVIARSYEPMFAAPSASMTKLGRYMLLRLQRLYPMLLLGGMVGIGAYAIGLTEYRAANHGDLARAIVSQFFLIPFLSAAGFFPLNRVQWTIVLELIANAVHAFLMPWLSIRVLCAIVMIAFAEVVYAQTCAMFGDVCRVDPYLLRISSRAFFGFFFGVLLCRTQDRWLRAVPELSFASLAALLFIVLCIPFEWTRHGIGSLVFELVCLAVMFPMIIMLGVKVNAGKLADVLGTISYPLYAIHLPVIIALRNGGVGEGPAIIAIAGLIALAWAIGRWIDEPLNARRHRLRRAAQDRSPGDAAAVQELAKDGRDQGCRGLSALSADALPGRAELPLSRRG